MATDPTTRVYSFGHLQTERPETRISSGPYAWCDCESTFSL